MRKAVKSAPNLQKLKGKIPDAIGEENPLYASSGDGHMANPTSDPGPTRLRSQRTGFYQPDSFFEKAQQAIPFLKWFPMYSWSTDFPSDLTGGIGIGLVCLAQTLAHAAIATTLPIQGPYCAFMPAIMYAIMGTSPHASVSSGAIAALVIADQLRPWSDIEERTQLASLLAFITGCWLILLGIFKFAFAMRFLSQPTLGGFITGGSIIICLEQFKNLLGYSYLPAYPELPPPLAVAKGLIVQLPQAEWQSILLGIFLMWVLEMCNRVKAYCNRMMKEDKKVARPNSGTWRGIISLQKLKRLTEMKEILATVIGASVGYLTAVTQVDGTRKPIMLVVGHIPPGLPAFQAPWDVPVFWRDIWTDQNRLARFVMGGFLVALSSFVTTFATAKKMALKFGYALDPSQEMIGLGCAGLSGSFFQAFPPSGSLSRTGLAADCGVKTQMGGLVSAGIIALGLQFLTPMLVYLPKATLAAIIITSTRNLIDFQTAFGLWKFWKPHKSGGLKPDLTVWTIAFVITSLMGVLQGILAAVVVSVGYIVKRAAQPEAVILGRVDEQGPVSAWARPWRNVEDWPNAQTFPGIMVYEFRGPLVFACAEYFQEEVEKARRRCTNTNDVPIEIVILSFASVHRTDTTGLQLLEDLLREWQDRKPPIACFVAGSKGQVRLLLEAKLGPEGAGVLHQNRYHIGINEAVKLARELQETLVKQNLKDFMNQQDRIQILEKRTTKLLSTGQLSGVRQPLLQGEEESLTDSFKKPRDTLTRTSSDGDLKKMAVAV